MTYVYRERSREVWEARLSANNNDGPIWDDPDHHIHVQRPTGSSYEDG